jgi:hypothetical protein
VVLGGTPGCSPERSATVNAMTERHEDPADRLTTGEFRAAPDISASTAQFQAFADSRPASGQWTSPAAPAPKPRRLTGLTIAGVFVVVVLVVVIAIVA